MDLRPKRPLITGKIAVNDCNFCKKPKVKMFTRSNFDRKGNFKNQERSLIEAVFVCLPF